MDGRNGGLPGEQRRGHRGADLIEDESIKLVGSNVAFRASPMLSSRPERIMIAAIVVIVEGPVAAAHFRIRSRHSGRI